MTAILEANHYRFGYRGKTIVAGEHLSLEAGQVLAIAGSNGSGKTTLFRGLLGLIAPQSGEVIRHTRAIGYVPQGEVLDDLYPLTATEVVQMGAFGTLRGWRRLNGEQNAHAQKCLERVELGDLGKHAYASLSGGQRQRVLLARALMVHPKLMLLDEPTSGVDPKAAQVIMDLVRQLSQEEGLAVAIVSHHLSELSRVATHCAWIQGGKAEVQPVGDGFPLERRSPEAATRGANIEWTSP
ncbi:MAG: metal ABC transporter ATP-binding protein [Planctomycetes bacterium]|nr:metal ABC transporter ATP-binding protein [Planctomycetota bacterium]